MTLDEIASSLRQVSDELAIFGRRPWGRDTYYEMLSLDSDYGIPESATSRGLDYFLEVHIALEICEVFDPKSPSVAEIAELMLYYANHDAFPDWVWVR